MKTKEVIKNSLFVSLLYLIVFFMGFGYHWLLTTLK